MSDVALLGVTTLVAGIVVILLATIMAPRREESGEADEGGKATVKGGGVVMIGPIPIIFGTDAKWAAIAVALAIVLIILSALVSGVLKA